MAIYTGKTNMIDKVVVTNGSTPEEMDYVYVTNALGKRELVFEQKPPAPDDNTQVDPPKMRKWSANIKCDVTGRLFWGNLFQNRVTSGIFYYGFRAYTSYSYRVSPYLYLKGDGKGGYTFSTRTSIQGNGWSRLLSYLRYPTASELTDLGHYAPYTGISPSWVLTKQVSGKPLANVFNKGGAERWKPNETNDVRSATMSCVRRKYSGATSLKIIPTAANGTSYLDLTDRGTLTQVSFNTTTNSYDFTTSIAVVFKRTSTYDEITVTGGSNINGSSKSAGYIIRLKKNVVSKEEPPISQLVETTNITRGVGGNPKAFRMGDDVNFTVDVTGEYI